MRFVDSLTRCLVQGRRRRRRLRVVPAREVRAQGRAGRRRRRRRRFGRALGQPVPADAGRPRVPPFLQGRARPATARARTGTAERRGRARAGAAGHRRVRRRRPARSWARCCGPSRSWSWRAAATAAAATPGSPASTNQSPRRFRAGHARPRSGRSSWCCGWWPTSASSGCPTPGKSTLLSRLTRANPKVAELPVHDPDAEPRRAPGRPSRWSKVGRCASRSRTCPASSRARTRARGSGSGSCATSSGPGCSCSCSTPADRHVKRDYNELVREIASYNPEILEAARASWR